MSVAERKAFAWLSGHPALDFVNTRAWYVESPQSERFRTVDDVLAWGRECGMLDEEDVAEWRRTRSRDEAAAARFFASALETRAALHRVLHAVGVGAPWAPDTPDVLRRFQERVSSAVARMRLEPADASRSLVRRWAWDDPHANPLLSRLTVDAGALLTGERAERLRACGNDRCGWVFLDTSRTGTRRWCDMRVCGNRVKARRRYARQRVEDP